MANKIDLDELEFEDAGDENEVDTPPETLVRGVFWQALSGDPLDNKALSDLLASMTMLSPNDIRQLVEDYFNETMAVSANSLRALERIIEMAEDIEAWDFVELMRIFETKLDEYIFREHDQDDSRHLTDDDRMTLDRVDELDRMVDDFVKTFGNQIKTLVAKINGIVDEINELESRVSKHIGDSDRHFNGDEKIRLFEMIANFDNSVYMRGCVIKTEFQSDTVTVETAWKGVEVFAIRTTTETDDNTVTEEIIFYLDHDTMGIKITTAFEGNDDISETIEEINFAEVNV